MDIFQKFESIWSIPQLVAAAPVSKLNIRKRYGKSGGVPTWVYDLPLKSVLKAA